MLGDVTGHGIDATADMAMAKFVFRSLAREHSEPSEFLAHANEVVVGEIARRQVHHDGATSTIDPRGRGASCASAGHPEPRLVRPDGTSTGLDCGGLALGIDALAEYEQVHAELPPGGAVVLYTDGVIESRSGRELFGVERLDAVLAANATQPAQVLADSGARRVPRLRGRRPPDDCAIVVINASTAVNLPRAGGRPLVIGHRGAAAVAPENTLAALAAAVAAGVDLVEFDVVAGPPARSLASRAAGRGDLARRRARPPRASTASGCTST